MNAIGYSVGPQANAFFERDDNKQLPPETVSSSVKEQTLAEVLEALYLVAVEQYKATLKVRYRQIRGFPYSATGTFPKVKVRLGSQNETLELGGDLDARLIEIYIGYGWKGILAVEGALEEAQKDYTAGKLHPWDTLLGFYLIARNRLILLLHEALVGVEQKSAAEIFPRLNQTSQRISEFWLRVDMHEELNPYLIHGTPEHGKPNPNHKGIFVPLYLHHMGNVSEARAIFKLVKAAVDSRARLAALNAELASLGAKKSVGDDQDTAAANAAELNKARKASAEEIQTFNNALTAIYNYAPLALLAFPLLDPTSDSLAMQQAIGDILAPFYRRIDDLARAINPQASQIAQDFPVPPMKELPATPAGLAKLARLFPLGYDLEAKVASAALDKVGKQPAYHVMLNLETLFSLINEKKVVPGSLEYFACRRFTLVVMEKIEAQAQFEQTVQTWLEPLNKISAMLGIWALMSFEVPPVAAKFGLLALLFGLPGLIFSVYAIVHKVAEFDQAIAQRTIQPLAANMDEMMKLGELAAIREEYVREIGVTVMKEIALVIAAHKWGVFKQVLAARGFYADVQALAQ